MSIYDVGVENLPNVYITRIQVSLTEIKVTCLLKDNKERSSWRGRQQMSNLKVKVLLVNDSSAEVYEEITSGLNNGTKSLFEYKASFISHFMKTESAEGFNLLQGNTEGKEENHYLKSFIFNNPATNNVLVYAACYIDGLQFENEVFNKFYGPMVSEYIYRNGQLNTSSGYFYFPETNEEYGGPVHYHSGKYMEGSRHRPRKHEELIYVSEPNSKIMEIE
tara:strand:- start:758 stop:1417 length:660 start_codon:yes stop_codon:yes gene_type:complete